MSREDTFREEQGSANHRRQSHACSQGQGRSGTGCGSRGRDSVFPPLDAACAHARFTPSCASVLMLTCCLTLNPPAPRFWAPGPVKPGHRAKASVCTSYSQREAFTPERHGWTVSESHVVRMTFPRTLSHSFPFTNRNFVEYLRVFF